MSISSTAAAAASSSSDWEEVLLNGDAYIGDERNHTTAVDFTRCMDRIMVSFWRERPPLLSRLYVCSLDLDSSAFSEPPRVLRVVEGLILFRVAIHCRQPRSILKEECDYFVYNVDCADLVSIPNPSPVTLRDDDVGLLRRGGRHYTVAALAATRSRSVFKLHLLHSGINQRWTSVDVSLKTPQREYPMIIPEEACRLLRHSTSTVITLGGEGGTMGWVDLWRGILLCDVLCPNPELRGVPAPLPSRMYLPNVEIRVDPVCPKPYRGIVFIKEKRCLRFVDLDITCQRLSDPDKETGLTSFRFDGWMITTWINFKLSNSFEDWKIECEPVYADNIRLNEQMRKQLLEYQLLQTNPKRKLENLWVSRPTPSMDGSNVFLIARAKFLHPEAYVLSLDMGNGELQGVSEYGTGRKLNANIICCHGSVSKRT